MSKRDIYRNYLKSDDWKHLREKACIRANYKCEFCGAPYENVHHVSYPKNLKDDTLENLIVVCKACHDKSHGIRKDEKKPRVYLIGKITKNGWRSEIYPELRGYDDIILNGDGKMTDIYDKYLYGGPIFIGCDHGCAHGRNEHGTGTTANNCCSEDSAQKIYGFHDPICVKTGEIEFGHGYEYEELSEESLKERQKKVSLRCFEWIKGCDICFTYIDTNDCHGSLVEIGLAYMLKKPIYIAFNSKKDYEDMWFCRQFATDLGYGFESPVEAWDNFNICMNFNK